MSEFLCWTRIKSSITREVSLDLFILLTLNRNIKNLPFDNLLIIKDPYLVFASLLWQEIFLGGRIDILISPLTVFNNMGGNKSKPETTKKQSWNPMYDFANLETRYSASTPSKVSRTNGIEKI